MNQKRFYKVTYYKLYGLIIYSGKTVQQSLSRLFNSHGQDFFSFLCWKNSSVKFTVEESSHVPGIQHMIPIIMLLANDLINICSEISKIRLALWMADTCNLKRLKEVKKMCWKWMYFPLLTKKKIYEVITDRAVVGQGM